MIVNSLNSNFRVEDLPNNILQKIYQYWLSMKGDRFIPSRADLDPTEITGLLQYISLIDVDTNTSRYKMRLIGTETVKAMGIDVTGKYLDEMPQAEALLKKNYDWLVQEKKPYINFDRLKWSSKTYLEYYALGLPLSENGEDVNMLMFGMYYQFPVEKRTKFYSIENRLKG
ncbi:hypothetical protein MNBD_ALPHA02-992 [hydrothermal vent metagenome]|uniref:PAS domain-containing protein n=1 Tax=hydrothermal vent metagenome TaxID=652676 RepID=A0A3B0RUY1_9ZZZZ